MTAERIAELERKLARERKRKRKVLIVCHPDNYLEVFGHYSLDVRFERVAQSQPENANKAIDIMNQQLPDNWKKVYWPGFLRGSEMLRPLTAGTICDAQYMRVMLAKLNDEKLMRKCLTGLGIAVKLPTCETKTTQS